MSEILQTQPSVKLYEYDYSKPDLLDDDILEHHGIKGQKHGVRNGPPYPLDSSISTGNKLKKTIGSIKRKAASKSEARRVEKAKKAKAKAEAERKKAEEANKPKYASNREAIEAKDLEYISQNKGKFSTNEMNEVMNRVNAEQRIDQMVYNQKQAKKVTNSKAFRIITTTAISGLSYAAVNYAMAGTEGRKNYSGKKFATDLAIGAGVGLVGQALPQPYSQSAQDIKRLKGLSYKK